MNKKAYEDELIENKFNDDVLEKYSDGNLKPTFKNMMILLSTDKELVDVFKYNEFINSYEVVRKTSWNPGWIDTSIFSDNDAYALRKYLITLKIQPSLNLIFESIKSHAINNKYHPIKDYFESLKWDGVSRIDNFFLNYMGSEDSVYNKTISKLMFISAVKRIFEPGCKFDYMFILEGAQRIGKSTAIEILCGRKYFGELNFSDKEKETIQRMQYIWIAEIAELTGFRKKDIESLKCFLSTKIDIIRPAYGREVLHYPRKSIFIGTINDDDLGYLQDMTGNRRFLPIRTYAINIDKIQKDRDLLWAEAFLEYKNGFPIYIKDEIIERIVEKQQKERLSIDPWEEIVKSHLENNIPYSSKFRMIDVYNSCISADNFKFGRREQMRLASIFKKLGYELKREMNKDEGKKERYYQKNCSVIDDFKFED